VSELERGGVVVGADETAAGIAAARWALAEGALRGLPVTVVRAWADPVTHGYGRGVPVTSGPEGVRRAAEDAARSVLQQAGGPPDGVSAEALAVQGLPAHVLSEASRTAELVVVGARAASALSRGVLGSVSSSVLHHASCPVVTVPEPAAASGSPGRVLVGVDHSPASLQALSWAADEAQRRSTVLVPVVVREPLRAGAGTAGALDLPRLEASEQAALIAAARRVAPSVRVEPEVLSGHAAQGLLDLATPDDLLVLGARGRGGFSSLLLGSTSTAVAQHARCPVVVLRPSRGGAA